MHATVLTSASAACTLVRAPRNRSIAPASSSVWLTCARASNTLSGPRIEPFRSSSGGCPGALGKSSGNSAALLNVPPVWRASSESVGSRSARCCVTRASAAPRRDRALPTCGFCRAAIRTASPSVRRTVESAATSCADAARAKKARSATSRASVRPIATRRGNRGWFISRRAGSWARRPGAWREGRTHGSARGARHPGCSRSI